MISFKSLRLVRVDISPEDLCSARCIVMHAPAMDILCRRTSQSHSPAVVLKGQRLVDAVNDCSEKVTAHWLFACSVLSAKLNRCVAHLCTLQLSDSQNEQGKNVPEYFASICVHLLCWVHRLHLLAISII